MELQLTHIAILTHFEATLTPLDFDTICAQDYAVHAIYNQATKSLVFLSNPKNFDGYEQVIKFKEMIEKLLIPVNWESKIIVMCEHENEYDALNVMKHFSH